MQYCGTECLLALLPQEVMGKCSVNFVGFVEYSILIGQSFLNQYFVFVYFVSNYEFL